MNLNKIYNEVVKNYLKGERKLNCGIFQEKYMGFTINGFIMFFVDKLKFPFAVDVVGRELNLKQLISPKEYTDAVLSSEIFQKDRKLFCQKITNGTVSVWVDVRNLIYFEEAASFKIGGSERQPVMVYEGDELAGAIMPVAINKEKEI